MSRYDKALIVALYIIYNAVHTTHSYQATTKLHYTLSLINSLLWGPPP